MQRDTSVRSRAWRFAREVLGTLALLILLQVGVVQAYHVPTPSMQSTIRTGDVFVADKITLGPRTPHWLGIPGTTLGVFLPALKLPGLRSARRGDVVVVDTPADPRTPYVKRVVAVGGDLLEIRDKVVYINGHPAAEPAGVRHGDPRTFPPGIAHPGVAPALGNRDQFGPIRIPDGSVFLMGDNRDDSFDSRYFGPLPEDRIIGKARFVTLSCNPRSLAESLARGFGWRRFGTPL